MLSVFGIFIIFIIFIWKFCKKDSKELPGPMALPIIGHLHLIGGKSLHLLLRDMSVKYGDVYNLKFGPKKAVVLCSRKAIKEAFVKQAKIFCGRPSLQTFAKTMNGQTGLSLCNYSNEYKENSRIAVTALHHFLSNEEYVDDVLQAEVKTMISLFKNFSLANKPFSPFLQFRHIVPKIFVSLMFGINYDFDDPTLNSVVNAYTTWFDAAEADNLADYFPFLLNFPNKRLCTVQASSNAFDKYTLSMINYLEKCELEGDAEKYNQSMFKALLTEYTKRNNAPMDLAEKKRLAKILSDLFGGGFDTVGSTLSWGLLYLMNQPEILDKCRKEICQQSTSDVSIRNKLHLPYFTATLYEILRLSSIAPLGICHQVIKDTTLMGYQIPKDTMVFANLWQINHDPNRWQVPDKLHPEHFLTESGEVDTVVVRDLMSFSTGVRQCSGRHVALAMMFAILGNFIKHFDMCIEQKPEDMSPTRGLTLKPKHYTITLSNLGE